MFSREINRGREGASDPVLAPDEIEVDLDPEGLESFVSYDEQAPQPPGPAGRSYRGEFED